MQNSTIQFIFYKKLTFLSCLFFILAFFSNSIILQAQEKKKFQPRYSGTVTGDVTMIANNVLNQHPTNSYHGLTDNQDGTGVYVDIDGDGSTFNSSSANLTNPEPGAGCLEFVKVYLYWAASDKEAGGLTLNDDTWSHDKLKLQLPSESGYTTITADEVIYRGRNEHFYNDPYICMKDITDNVMALNSPYGKYQIANLKAAHGGLNPHDGGNFGVAGGWQIVFVYQSPDLTRRNITLFDGYAHVANNQTTNFKIDGFQTVPFGEVKADFVLGVIEGDRVLNGDKFEIKKPDGNWQKLSSLLRNEDNFFNSRITRDGLDFIDRNPASTNTLGFDASIFKLNNVGNTLIANNQTKTDFRATSGSESYGLYLVGLSVEVYEPNLGSLDFTTNPLDSSYDPSETATMVVNVKNSGNDDIQNLEIEGIIPPEVELVEPINLPSWINYNYNAGNRKITFDVEDGYTDVSDDAYNIQFDMVVKDQCYFLEGTCAGNFSIQMEATYRGVINNDEQTTNSSGTQNECGFGNHDPSVVTVNSPDAIEWGTAANALNRTISCDSPSALSAAQALEPLFADCSFTIQKTGGAFVPSLGCESEGTYTNTFIFTDACGRESQPYTQIITVEDTTAPVFNEILPSNTVAAYDNIPAPTVLTANDNCDSNPQVNLTENYIGDNNSTTYTIIRTWTASDCAGNTTEHVQRIYVTENGDPIGLSIDDVTVNENAGSAIFTIRLVGDITGGFTVDYQTVNGTAGAPDDFSALAPTSQFFNGDHAETKTLTVDINDDNQVERTEEFLVELSNLSTTLIGINDANGSGTIIDNDNASISIADIDVNETAGFANVQVTLSGNVQEAFTIDYQTSNSGASATPNVDYTTVNSQLSWGSNATDGASMTVAVPILDDNLIELTENFFVLLSNVNAEGNISLVGNTATVNILDNDGGAGTGISFDNTDVTVNEGDGTATFNVVLAGNVAGGFSLDYATDNGSAVAPGDYTTNSGQLTFLGNDGESHPITVAIVDDNIIEATENFLVNLSDLSTTLISINTPQANGNIIDNDGGAGTGISFDNTDVTVNEGDGTATFNVVLAGNVAGGFSLDYATDNGSAVAPGDYTTNSGQLTFLGNDGESHPITVAIVDDNIIEATENFLVNLSNLSTTLISINTPQANGNIIDNDGGAGTGISFDNTDVTVNEGDGTATFNVVLAGNVAGGFSLDYATDNGSAVAPGDYTTNSGQLTFAGNNGESHPITVAINDDDLIEFTEKFFVNLSNLSTSLISINTPQANGNIVDNDAIAGTGIAFDNDNITVDEAAGTATVNVMLTGNVPGGFTLDYASADNTATSGQDYVAKSGTLTFNGTDGETVPVSITINDDNFIEVTESLFINLSNLSTSLISINDSQATINITDNDGGLGTGLFFDNTDVIVNEGDGTATFNVSFVGNFPVPFTVEYDSNDGTAINGQDYTGVANLLTFSGSNGQVLLITVPIIDDTVIEPTEDYNVNLFNVSSSLIALNMTQARGSIIDNDAVTGTGIEFTNTNIIVTEGTDTFARFTVTLTGEISENVTVDYSTNNGTAIDGTDITAQSGTITFTQTVKSFDIDVPIINDLIIESQEAFTVVLSNVVSNLGIGFTNGQPTNTANGTINDDDASAENGISFVNTNVEVSEGVGVTATFEVALTGNFQDAFDVAFETAFGTATVTDLVGQNDVISFAGNDGEVQTIVVTILDDNIIEPTEAYVVNLTGTTNSLVTINTPQANGSILDDDLNANDGISFVSTNVEVTEGVGVTATFEVALTGNFQDAFDVDFETVYGTATDTDFVEQNDVISFSGNDGEVQTIVVTILDDNIIEPTEAYVVNLIGTTNPLAAINTPQANGSILDDDLTVNDGVSFVNTNVEVTEGVDVTATFEVALTGNFQDAFDVVFETAFGSATDTDFVGQNDVISFAGNDGEVQTIVVTILDDNIIEPTEGYLVTLTGTTNPLVSINTPQANGSILDDDMDPSFGVQFDVTSIDINEAAGTVSLNVILNAEVQNEFTVEYNTTDGTATDAFDYTGVSVGTQTLTFGGTNANTQIVTLPIIDDIIIEDTENFSVLLSNISTSLVNILSNDIANVDITDNDGNEGWPEDMTIEACDTIPTVEEITSTSSCEITVVLDEVIEGQDDECATEYTITRTWTITDCVGNVRDNVQVITIEDTVAPTFTEALPQDMTIACNEVPDAIVLTAMDSCEPGIEVVFNEVVTNSANCATGYTVTRTWSASDCAGNMVDHTQVITVPPTGPIMASPYEEEITILCGDMVPDVPELTFTGGCGNFEVVFNEEVDRASDSDDFMIIRTWEVTDSCGNSAAFEQIIFVMQPQLEEVTIDICIEEIAIDLLNYLPEGFDANGEFMILEGEVTLNGSMFDPLDHQPGEYKITYSSVGGECKYYVDFTIIVNTDCVPCGRDQIEISKAITPNGDGVNDKFEIRGVEFCQFTFDIMLFNRWGNKVAEVKDYKNNWGGESPSGSFGASGMLPAGTYYYIISATDTETGKTLEPLNGYIYLGSN